MNRWFDLPIKASLRSPKLPLFKIDKSLSRFTRTTAIATSMIIVLSIAACGSGIVPDVSWPTDTPSPTWTPRPTNTPRPTPTPAPVVIFNKLKIIQDGGSFNLGPLDAGTYLLEMTATGFGAAVQWMGGNCKEVSREIPNHRETCTLHQTGQLKVYNPSALGMGPSTSVTIKVTQLPY